MRSLIAGMIVLVVAARAGAQQTDPLNTPFNPPLLSLQPAQPESIYAPPSPTRESPQVNEGAVHFDLAVSYLTDYVYRGIEIFEPPGAEDQANIQIDSKLSFDLGKLPHPFIQVFVNVAESDPISTFQEIRPIVGFDWFLRPLIFSAGHTTYFYPDRDDFQTNEIWGRIEIDDSYFLNSSEPLLSPYILAAYDYDLYNGWYFEAGVSHDWEFEDFGLVITAQAHAAYIHGMQLFTTPTGGGEDNGFQHYQVGLIGTYSLNKLFNFSTRFGTWSLQGFIYYTDGIDEDLAASDQVWGGTGILFQY